MPPRVDSRHWTQRAAEARNRARQLTDADAQRAMEDVASAYEQMAARAAERERRSGAA